MPAKIRLARYGAKKNPFYRIVVINSENARNGKFIEIVGTYDPKKESAKTTWKKDRVDYWMGVGATPTQTVSQLMQKELK